MGSNAEELTFEERWPLSGIESQYPFQCGMERIYILPLAEEAVEDRFSHSNATDQLPGIERL
jgi:hypothetical protein